MKLWVFTTIFAVIGIGAMASAKPAFVKDFTTVYGVKKTSALGQASCSACHVAKTTKLNPYGQDLKNAITKEGGTVLTVSAMKKVESLDSDKDGKSNLEELRAGTLPGDAKSK